MESNTYLPLLKLFFKSILNSNQQTKILPIQTDSKAPGIKTTSDTTKLTAIGAKQYFKGNRGTIRSLAGEFHISTNLTFEDLVVAKSQWVPNDSQ
jgi:hypothetical protein